MKYALNYQKVKSVNFVQSVDMGEALDRSGLDPAGGGTMSWMGFWAEPIDCERQVSTYVRLLRGGENNAGHLGDNR